MRITEFLTQFRCSPRTRETYAKYLQFFADYLRGEGIDIADATPAHFEAMANARGWHANSARLGLAATKAYVRHFHGSAHPLVAYRIKRAPSPIMRAMTPENVRKLLAVCDSNTRAGAQYVVIILVLYDTWMRASELCRLRVEDLDIPNRKLKVLTKGSEWEPKVFSDMTAAYLEAWLIERRGIARPDCPSVFCNVLRGTQLTRDGLRGNFNRLGAKAGIKVSPHDFRRGGPSQAARRGIPDRLGMLQGGWKDHRQYQRYTESLTVDDLRPYFPTNELGVPLERYPQAEDYRDAHSS